MAKKSNGEYEVIWPRGERKQALRPLAKRLDTLAGKTVAQLWDYLFAGDEVFATLEETLRARYPGVKFVSWREFGSTHAVNEKELLASLPERFKELGGDAANSSMARRGSCTPAVLRASEACERGGFPTSSLVCEGFLGQAAPTSVGLGMPSLPVAVIPGHPGAQSAEELRTNVYNVTAQQVIDNLLMRPAEQQLAPEPASR